MKEETCLILDFMPNGYADRRKSEPIAQAMGTAYFSLLELVPIFPCGLIVSLLCEHLHDVYNGEEPGFGFLIVGVESRGPRIGQGLFTSTLYYRGRLPT